MKVKELKLAQLVQDMGGPRAVSEAADIPRTAAYRWMRGGNVTLKTLENIPGLRLYYKLDKRLHGTNDYKYRRRESVADDDAGPSPDVSGNGLVSDTDKPGHQEASDPMEGVPDPATNRGRSNELV